jgi:hypothetical protein
MNPYFARLFVFVITSALMIACGSGSDATDSETGDEQDVVAAGKACGDDVAIRKKCAAGLTCVFPTSGPISEHTPGVCKAVSQRNGECGDDVAIQKVCAAGLTCVFPTTGPISEHTPGTCKSVSQRNEPCGDDVAIQKVCAAGLKCIFPTGGPISEHTAGTCE